MLVTLYSFVTFYQEISSIKKLISTNKEAKSYNEAKRLTLFFEAQFKFEYPRNKIKQNRNMPLAFDRDRTTIRLTIPKKIFRN